MSAHRELAPEDLTQALEIETIETRSGVTYTFTPVITREYCVLHPVDDDIWPYVWHAKGNLPSPWNLKITRDGSDLCFSVQLQLEVPPGVIPAVIFPLLLVPRGTPMDVRRAIDTACYLLDGWGARYRARDHA